MKKTFSKIAVVIMAVLMIISCTVAVNAENNGKITINVTVKSTGAAPENSVKFIVYKIAFKSEEGLKPTIETTLDVTDASEANLKNLEKFCRENNILGTPITTDKATGMAVFEGIDDGIYLVVLENASDSIYAGIVPSHIVIENGAQKTVNIELSEKYPAAKETEKDTTKDTTAQTTTKAQETTTAKESEIVPAVSDTAPTSETAKPLGQTGMVQWPIPVFGGLGLALVIIGIIALVSNKKKVKRSK